jgi:NAD(P) transhydrogenase subunit alpha
MVGLTPESVKRLVQSGQSATVETGAGERSGWNDRDYAEAGAAIGENRAAMLSQANVVAAVEASWDGPFWDAAGPGLLLVGMLRPFTVSQDIVQSWLDAGITAMSLDALPRVSRAQSMDVLSSLSTVMGYRAVTLAAERLRKFFPLLMTAAGTIPPARVLVLGAGVAGLQAIAMAHRLGAVVEAFDTRPEVREQVESLGAAFLTLEVESGHTADGYAAELGEEAHRRETERLADPVARADVVITTAQIPGQPAPVLVTRAMIERMRPGSVIVDLAAESGGNTEVTRAGAEIDVAGVRIIGPKKLASELPRDASQLFSRNLTNFLQHVNSLPVSWTDEGRLSVPDDELVGRTVLVHEGRVVHAGLSKRMEEGGRVYVAHR